MSLDGYPYSPSTHHKAKRRSQLSSSGSSMNNYYSLGMAQQHPQSPQQQQQTMGSSQRTSYSLSRRSSQSSIRTVATSHSINSSATSTSVCSAKFERAYASQAHKWTTSAPGIVRHPSISSQFSIASTRSLPPHVVGKRSMLQRQLKAVETLLQDTQGLVISETGSVGWLLAHERHLLNIALKYDERARSEWEASQDWHVSAQEGPVSKIFVTQPSRFGLTPEQHRYRLGQARTLGNNALDLWRFSDLNYQDAFKIRGARERLQSEQDSSRSGAAADGWQSSKADALADSACAETPTVSKEKDKLAKKDFKTWLKEVSKNDSEALKSVVVKHDGTLDKLAPPSKDPETHIAGAVAPVALAASLSSSMAALEC